MEYSVIIRTTGKAGEKYQRLLDSIQSLDPVPAEVIVVLPEGYDLPAEKLGWETYCFSKKGMVTQRLEGIYRCKTEYALICDDDVCFASGFVRELHQPIEMGLAQISAAPLLSFLPKKGIESVCYALTGAALPRVLPRGKYISVLPTTGYSYYRGKRLRDQPYLLAESLPWTCFYGRVDSIRSIQMEDELWLEKSGYASMDDQTMFYKAYLRGIKTVVVTNAEYEHLDARTSRKVLSDIAYAMEFNRYVFWHRFIFCMDSEIKRLWDLICVDYYFIVKWLYNRYRYMRCELDKDALSAKKKALINAKEFVRSKEYLNLPSVK